MSDTELIQEAIQLVRNEGTSADLLRLLKQGVPANATDDEGYSLLMFAAFHDNLDLVSTLLDAGADLNSLNKRAQTALALAVVNGNTEIVNALMTAGADPRLGSPSAIDAAQVFGQTQLLELLEA